MRQQQHVHNSISAHQSCVFVFVVRMQANDADMERCRVWWWRLSQPPNTGTVLTQVA